MQISSFVQKKNRSRYIVISTVFLLLFISPLAVFAQVPDSIATLRQMGKAFAYIAEKASPAVVSLKSERTVTREYPSMQDMPFGEPFSDPFEFFFRRRSPRQRPQQRQYQEPRTAQGSGFIISADGYILTNNHMVEGAEKVEVELTDGRQFTAKIIGTDSDSDVAVVKIDARDLAYLELADSDTLEVGEWVLAIGNPLGLSHTVTAGIVSAKGRSGFGLAELESFIQTDAAINFGNSGGPLINLDGKVVGINTAIAGSTGNIGIGFAIPINMAKHAYEQLVESGTVERGFLGVVVMDLTSETAPFFGLEKNAKGVLIPEVTEGSAADKAGIKHNDVVLELNGKPVESRDAFRNQIAMFKPDSQIQLVVWRDGKRKPLTVKLDKRPPTEEITGELSPETINELGFTVEDITDELAGRYGYKGQSGVVVKEVESGSQAEQKGIAPGALIKEVNQQKVGNTREFNDAIKKARKEGGALLLVKWGRYTIFVPLKLSEK
ncbi:MAG TPA: Do family serine endopeptidase [Sedimentisphaerales bacterium]|nr:Do family serine endopeptidase [Sedimentisphaerales bacterium]